LSPQLTAPGSWLLANAIIEQLMMATSSSTLSGDGHVIGNIAKWVVWRGYGG